MLRFSLMVVLWAGLGFTSDPLEQLRQWEDSSEVLDWAIREASTAAVIDSNKIDSLKNVQLSLALKHRELRDEVAAGTDWPEPNTTTHLADDPLAAAENGPFAGGLSLWAWATAAGLAFLLVLAYWYWFKRPFDGHRLRRKFQQANATGSGGKSGSPKRTFHSLPEVAREAMEEPSSGVGEVETPASGEPDVKASPPGISDDPAAAPPVDSAGFHEPVEFSESEMDPPESDPAHPRPMEFFKSESILRPTEPPNADTPPDPSEAGMSPFQSEDPQPHGEQRPLRAPGTTGEPQSTPDFRMARTRITDKIEIQKLTILRLAKRGATASEISQRLRISREKVELVIRHALENKH